MRIIKLCNNSFILIGNSYNQIDNIVDMGGKWSKYSDCDSDECLCTSLSPVSRISPVSHSPVYSVCLFCSLSSSHCVCSCTSLHSRYVHYGWVFEIEKEKLVNDFIDNVKSPKSLGLPRLSSGLEIPLLRRS
jgi:hypothetical protein